MSDVNANIGVNIDSSQALDELKRLQRQISEFNLSVLKSNEAAALAQKSLQKNFINSINSIGSFSAELRTVNTTAESFTKALENNKLSMREYFRYAGASTKTFGNQFKSELDTINKVAVERVKTLQTQYIKLGRDANGAMKAIAIRPLALDMDSLATKTQIAAQKQAMFNQLLKQGSTNLLNFGKNTQWAGRQLMVGFTLPLAAFGATAAKAFQTLETEVIKFKKVYGDLGTDSKQTDEALKNIQKLADGYTKYGVEVSKTVGLASQAAAAGFQGADLMAQTDAATKLAILGQIDQQQALETTISLQNAFKISSTELASTIDFLNAVENQTVTSLDDITTAIPKVAPVIQSLGGNVKDLAFFLTAMKEGGVNAAEGANALKSGLASLINPSKKANDMLSSMGININNIVTKNQGNLKATVIEFAKALDTLDPLARARAIETMFGKFQFARISTLLSNVTQQGNQASRVLDLANQSASALAGTTEKELGITAASSLVKFQAAMAKLRASLAPIGEVFMKAFTPILEFVTKVLDKFNHLSDGTKKAIAIVVGVVGGLGPVLLMTFGLLANGIANIIKLFATLRNGYQRLTGQSQNLGEQTQYMTSEQLDAAAAAHSLEQSHARLTQQFTAEATEVNLLRIAYQDALAAASRFAMINPGMMKTPKIPGFAGGTAGIISGPGTGTSDSILARVSNGEAIVPARIVNQYPGLVSNLVSGRLPGFAEGLDPNASWIESIASRGSTQRTQASVRSYLTGEIQKISQRAGTFKYSEATILSDFKSFIDTTTSGLQNITKSGLDSALKQQRQILSTYSPQSYQGEKNNFAHIGSGIDVTAKDLLSSGAITNPRVQAKLAQLAQILPNKEVGVKSGFGFDIMGALNVDMGKTGADLKDVIKSFKENGIDKWRKTIEIGGGSFDRLSSQVTEYDKRFSQALESRLAQGATTIVDTNAELQAARLKVEKAGGTFNKNLYVVVEEVDAQVRSGLGAFGKELNSVITQAINTITEVRVNLTAQEDLLLGGNFLEGSGKGRLSGRLASGGSDAGRIVGGQGKVNAALKQAAIASTNDLITTVSATAGVASPSKRTIPIGQDIMRGLEVGIESQLPETIAVAEAAAAEVLAAQEAVLVSQSGRRVAAATAGSPQTMRKYNPAAAAPPGVRLLPIVPLGETAPAKTNRFAGKGGMMAMGGMMLGSMALSAAPEFTGKSIAQSALNMGSMGAGIGMFFGPEGAAIGAAIGAGVGVATSAVSMLMDAEKKHEAIARSTFTNSAGDVTFFGDKVLNTTLKLDTLGFSVKGITDKFGFANAQIQAFVKYINGLDASDPTKIFVENLKGLDKVSAITGNIREKVANQISTGGLDPKNAKDYVAGLLEAAGKSRYFEQVWKNIQKSILDEGSATKTALNKMFAESGLENKNIRGMSAWQTRTLDNGVTKVIYKQYKDLSKAQQEFVGKMKDTLGVMLNGSLTSAQFAQRLQGVKDSALNGAYGIQMLRYAIESTGDKKALAAFDSLGFALDTIGVKSTEALIKILAVKNANITPQQAAQMLGEKYYANLPQDIKDKQDTSLLLRAGDTAAFKALQDARNKVYNKINGFTDNTTTATDGLSAAAKAYLKILDAEIKALEKKADAQKAVNDEIQRNIDYENKQQELASQIAKARMSGDYLTATILQQEAAQNQLTFNQDTAYNKLQAQLKDLKARYEELSNGANMTPAENTKLANSKKVKKADGGMITHYDNGGGVSGPGTGTSDSIPAMLSNGEYVVKAAAVNQYGVPLLHAINSQKFNTGGFVQHFKDGTPGAVKGEKIGKLPEDFSSKLSEKLYKSKPFEWTKPSAEKGSFKEDINYMTQGPRSLYNNFIRPIIFSGNRMMVNKPKNYGFKDSLYDSINIGSFGISSKVKAGQGVLSPLAEMAFEKATARQGVQVFDKRFPKFINNMMEMGILKPSKYKARVDELLTDYARWAKLSSTDSPEILRGNPSQSLNIYPRRMLDFVFRVGDYKRLGKVKPALGVFKDMIFKKMGAPAKYASAAFHRRGVTHVSMEGSNSGKNTIIHELGHRNEHLSGGIEKFLDSVGIKYTPGETNNAREAYAQMFEHWLAKGIELKAPAYDGILKIKSPFEGGSFYNHHGEDFASKMVDHLLHTAPGVTDFREFQHGAPWLSGFADTVEALSKRNFSKMGIDNLSAIWNARPTKAIDNARQLAAVASRTFFGSKVENHLMAKLFDFSSKDPKVLEQSHMYLNALRKIAPNSETFLKNVEGMSPGNIISYIKNVAGKKNGGLIQHFGGGGLAGIMSRFGGNKIPQFMLSAGIWQTMEEAEKFLSLKYGADKYDSKTEKWTKAFGRFAFNTAQGTLASIGTGNPYLGLTEGVAEGVIGLARSGSDYGVKGGNKSKLPKGAKAVWRGFNPQKELDNMSLLGSLGNVAKATGVGAIFGFAGNRLSPYLQKVLPYAKNAIASKLGQQGVTSRLRNNFEVIKAENKLSTPEGDEARVALAQWETLMAARINKFTPLMDLKNMTSQQLIAENQAMPSLIEEPFTLNGKNFIFKFTKHTLRDTDAPVIDNFLTSIKNPHYKGLGEEKTVVGEHKVEIIDPLNNRTAAGITYDTITGAIRFRQTDPQYQGQGLSEALYNKAATISRIRHSAHLSQAGRASAPKIGGFMSYDDIYGLPGLDSLKGTSNLQAYLQRFAQKSIKPIKPKNPKNPKETKKPYQPDRVIEVPGSDSTIGWQNDRIAEYNAELRANLRPETIEWFANGFRTSRNFPYGNNGYVEPAALPELQRIKDLEARRGVVPNNTTSHTTDPFQTWQDPLSAWRNNERRTYSSYPGIQGSGSYIAPEDLFDMLRLQSKPDTPAGFPWARNQESYSQLRPFDGGSQTPRGATGGFLDKEKFIVPKFANSEMVNLPKFHNWNGVVPGPYGQELNAVLKSGTEGVYQNQYIAGLKNAAAGNTSTSNANTVYNIDMTVNGGSANANEIANQVMAKLKVVANQNNKTNKVTF